MIDTNAIAHQPQHSLHVRCASDSRTAGARRPPLQGLLVLVDPKPVRVREAATETELRAMYPEPGGRC
jgi:hypothetical protein